MSLASWARFLLKRGGFLVLVGAFGACVSSAHGTEVSIPALKARPGQSVDIPIMIDEVENLAGIKLVVKYDPEILSFKKGAKTRHSDSLIHIVNDKNPGLLIILLAGARGIRGKDFPIFTLTFEISKSLKEKHNTTLGISEVEMMSDELKKIDGSVRVGPLVILP